MTIKDIITPTFIEKLLDNLRRIGIGSSSIECILLEGSALYLKKVNDIDFKIIVKRYFNKAETMRYFEIDGYRVECVYYTPKDWANVFKYKANAQYIVESKDMICVYGDDSKFVRHDIINDVELQKYVLNVYDENFFNYKEDNKRTYQMEDKRLWNFLLFAFKLKNQNEKLSKDQLALLQKAHDLELAKEDYISLFDELKEIIFAKS